MVERRIHHLTPVPRSAVAAGLLREGTFGARSSYSAALRVDSQYLYHKTAQLSSAPFPADLSPSPSRAIGTLRYTGNSEIHRFPVSGNRRRALGAQRGAWKVFSSMRWTTAADLSYTVVAGAMVRRERTQDDNLRHAPRRRRQGRRVFLVRRACALDRREGAAMKRQGKTNEMDTADLKAVLTDHEAWLAGRGGQRANLNGADLNGANLRRANLRYANLRDANLNGANLIDADLSVANLSGADLSVANLSGADLSRANLNGANLIGANLIGANLSGANLNGANLSDANLYRANLRDAYLSGADLSDADLRDAYLSGAYLSRADLRDANLSGANLSDANLRGASLSRADLYRANLSDADLSYAKLSGANLSGADLSVANLSGAALIGAKLSWTEHSLLSEVLWRAATTESRQMLAAYVGRKTTWCWDEWSEWEHPEREWALDELAKWVQDNDGAPECVRDRVEEADRG